MKETAYTARIGLKDQLSIMFVSNDMTRVGFCKWSRGNRTSQQLMGPIFFFVADIQSQKIRPFNKKTFLAKKKTLLLANKKRKLYHMRVSSHMHTRSYFICRLNPSRKNRGTLIQCLINFVFINFLYIIINVNTFWDLITGFSFFFGFVL